MIYDEWYLDCWFAKPCQDAQSQVLLCHVLRENQVWAFSNVFRRICFLYRPAPSMNCIAKLITSNSLGAIILKGVESLGQFVL